MDSQEQFYKEQFQQLFDARNAKEEKFEESQLNVREKVTKVESMESSAEERLRRSLNLHFSLVRFRSRFNF